jgi:hypothetical protein
MQKVNEEFSRIGAILNLDLSNYEKNTKKNTHLNDLKYSQF